MKSIKSPVNYQDLIIAKYKGLTGVFIVLSGVYLALAALLPPDKASLVKYRITEAQIIALTLTIAIPYLIIWFTALVGYLRLKSYTYTIRDSQDGAAFRLVAWGTLVLALWLPFSAIVGSLTEWYGRVHPSAAAWMVNLNNYSTLLILLLAFAVLNRGSKQFLAIVKKSEVSLPQPLMLLFIAFSVLYVFMVLHDPARQFPTHSVQTASYYLPDWLTITTIVIPRLITWFLGIQAIQNIYLYRKKIKGPIYRQALDSLAKGLAWVIVTIIVLRCFQSLSSQFNKLSLGFILLIIYALLGLISTGYIFIAKGAQKLQRIEEI